MPLVDGGEWFEELCCGECFRRCSIRMVKDAPAEPAREAERQFLAMVSACPHNKRRPDSVVTRKGEQYGETLRRERYS